MPPEREKGKHKAYEDEKPYPPDPGENGARFLGWIKKRGFNATFRECSAYCSPLGIDLKEFVKEMDRRWPRYFSNMTMTFPSQPQDEAVTSL
jgi:hypothetical protein